MENKNACLTCRHFQPVEQGIVDGLYLTNLMYEDGNCLLHGWEVTATYYCDDYELGPTEIVPAPPGPGPA